MGQVEQPRKWWIRAPKPEPVDVNLDALTKPELAAMAEDAGVDPSGTKAELVEKLEDAADE